MWGFRIFHPFVPSQVLSEAKIGTETSSATARGHNISYGSMGMGGQDDAAIHHHDSAAESVPPPPFEAPLRRRRASTDVVVESPE